MNVTYQKYKIMGTFFLDFHIKNENNKEIISLSVELKEDVGYLSSFFFSLTEEKKYIGKGYGSFLLKETLKILKEQGIKKVWLVASSGKVSEEDKYLSQKELIKFYRKNGFKRDSLFKQISFLKNNQDLSKKELILKWIKDESVPMTKIL